MSMEDKSGKLLQIDQTLDTLTNIVSNLIPRGRLISKLFLLVCFLVCCFVFLLAEGIVMMQQLDDFWKKLAMEGKLYKP